MIPSTTRGSEATCFTLGAGGLGAAGDRIANVQPDLSHSVDRLGQKNAGVGQRCREQFERASTTSRK